MEAVMVADRMEMVMDNQDLPIQMEVQESYLSMQPVLQTIIANVRSGVALPTATLTKSKFPLCL